MTTEDEILKVAPDPVRVARTFAQRLRANAVYAESVKFSMANLSTMKVEDCRALADWIDGAGEIAEAEPMARALAAE